MIADRLNYEQDGIVHAVKDPPRAGIDGLVCEMAQNQCVCQECRDSGQPGATKLVSKPVTCVVCLAET